MKTSKLFWGFVLVTLGALFLLENLGYINFQLSNVWRLWPIILIYTGVDILFGKSPQAKIPILIISVILFLTFIFYAVYKPSVSKNNIEWDVDTNEDDYENETKAEKSYSFNEAYDSTIAIAKLNLDFGAGNLKINGNSDQLIEAKVSTNFNNYEFTTDKLNNTATVNLNSVTRSKRHFKSGVNNKLNIKLNTNPLWDLTADFGAANVDLDLSEYKINSLSANFGAAKMSVKLGDKQENSNIKVEMGAANFILRIPKTVGCQVKTDSGLTSKEFEDFKKSKEDTWETEDFKTAKKKIFVSIESGVSKVKIITY